MKKIGLFIVLLSASVLVMAKGPAIKFEKTTHDFGQVEENGGIVKYDFEFENIGDEPLVISRVGTTCGCTTPEWTKTPVEPGQKGHISVAYNPKGRPGAIAKTATVVTNIENEEPVLLHIKGKVEKAKESEK